MASGVVAALTAQGMSGIPVGGQDGDLAAINRVALGMIDAAEAAGGSGQEPERAAAEPTAAARVNVGVYVYREDTGRAA